MNALYRLHDRLNGILYRVAQILEVIVSIIVAVAIVLSFSLVLQDLNLMVHDPSVGLHDFLSNTFTVVIGIEFLKMLCRHNLSSVVEVLLFALARGLVVDHGTPLGNLITVGTIALLFLVRKYLFMPGLDDRHHREHLREGDGPAGAAK